jgi:lipopolysaccharide export system protein LptC
MPEVARTPRQMWARPGTRHDILVKLLRFVLPVGVVGLAGVLIAAPLANRSEISFLLDKNKVSMAKERLRVTAASYRGEDNKGQPFEIMAGSAVQTTSKDPVVRMRDLSARITLADGPATVKAGAGRYDMDRKIVMVDGPIVFQSSDGYRLQTRDVAVGIDSRTVASGGPVDGQMPLGSFSAGRMTADLDSRSVVLEGRARLRIVQGGVR